MRTNFLIVGQGLAGSLLAWELLARGKRVFVVDRDEPDTSSKVAAGIVTPITGQRVAPSWRVDDIMISYAADQGGVGPHTDAYDVFLMQARGTRRWRLSYREYTDDDLLPGLDMRVLKRFDTDQEWLLQGSDV